MLLNVTAAEFYEKFLLIRNDRGGYIIVSHHLQFVESIIYSLFKVKKGIGTQLGQELVYPVKVLHVVLTEVFHWLRVLVVAGRYMRMFQRQLSPVPGIVGFDKWKEMPEERLVLR